jgi:single-strand DNA-binding protein
MKENIVKITGKVLEGGPTQFITDRYSKRSLVLDITDNPKYPNYLSIEFSNDKTELLDNLKAGDDLKATIVVKGRAWVDKNTGVTKYFNSLEGIGLEYAPVNDVRPVRPAEPTQRVEDNLQTKQVNNAGSDLLSLDEDDDLPF